jgi:transcriptional regulator with XRE-family HTH domain
MARVPQHSQADIELPLFARRLKMARVRAGLSQEKLGVAAGVDEFSASARLNQYERGKHTPDILMASHLATALNVPLSYFYAKDEGEAKLLTIFYRLSEAKQLEALAMLQTLLEQA